MARDETLAATDHEEGARDEPALRRRSRRALLGGGLAAAGAGIAGTLLATASPAGADDTPVLLGEANGATNTTSVDNTNGTCFEVTSSSGQPVLVAFDSSSGNAGGSEAVYGQSSVSAGVAGYSDTNAGVAGVASGAGGIGVLGQGTEAAGVYGQLDPGSTTLGIAAVIGFDPTSAPGNTGVSGESFNGIGVSGIASVNGAPGGIGVTGQTYGDGGYGTGGSDASAGGGYGVLATTNNGVALNAYVSQEGNGSGWALQVGGPAQFSTGGTAVIPSGKSSVTVNVPGVTPASFVVATLQGTPAGHHVQSAVAGTGTVTIYLNASTSAARTVGFLALVPSSVTPPLSSRRPSLPRLGRLVRRPAAVPARRRG
jgi:hypothetical protein